MMTAAPLDPYSTAANAWRGSGGSAFDDNNNNDDVDLKNLMDALSPEDQAYIRMLLRSTKAAQVATTSNGGFMQGQEACPPISRPFDDGDLSPQSTSASSCNDLTAVADNNAEVPIEMPASILDLYNFIPIVNSTSPAPTHLHKATDGNGMSLTARRRKARRQNRVASCSRTPAIGELDDPKSPKSPVALSDSGVAAESSNKVVVNNKHLVVPASNGGPTTMMIRNVPKRYTQRMLIQELAARGFEGTFDFFYLPTDISSGRNLGYAFVNFLNPTLATAFKSVFHKLHLPGSTPTMAVSSAAETAGVNNSLSISVAVVQGLQRNLDNLVRNASVHRIKNPEYLPLVIDPVQGCLVPYAVPSHSHKGATNNQHPAGGVVGRHGVTANKGSEARRQSGEKHQGKQHRKSVAGAQMVANNSVEASIPSSCSSSAFGGSSSMMPNVLPWSMF